MVDPTGMLATARTENSRRVFSTMVFKVDGAMSRGSVAARVMEGRMRRCWAFLRSDSGFSMKFVGKSKPLIHYPVFTHNRRKQAELAELACISNGCYTDISS
jgi:hypothetical protein